MKFWTVIAALALILGGCAKKNDTPEAIKQGVIRDISKSFNMANMDVIVDSVSFRDKEADATVTFTIKGGTAAQGMSMRYVMERRDDNQWYIKSRASTGAGAPGGSGAMPAGHPGMGSAPMDGPVSATGASKLNLPPDHPDIGK